MPALDEKVVLALHAEAQARWPHVTVSLARFEQGVRRAMASVPLEQVQASDLFLVLGCLDRQARAIAEFERYVMDATRLSVERACRGSTTNVEDVMQWTREKLLVGEPPVPPKLTQYTGRGALVGWVRVVAVREALQDRRRSKREHVADAVALVDDGSAAVGFELRLLRERHAQDLRAAIEEALRRLSAEQRSILRLQAHDGLTIDQIAPMLGVHRATAARRLERARAAALEHTRAVLRERHGLSESEARSLCTALGTEVDISFSRAFASELR